MYYLGSGVPEDHSEAAKWLRMAADLGHKNAMYKLGVMYDEGDGVPQDYAKAKNLYEKAAYSGFSPAMIALGILYFQGHGVPQDNFQAYIQFSLAAYWGDPNGTKAREIVARHMTPVEIKQAKDLLKSWGKLNE